MSVKRIGVLTISGTILYTARSIYDRRCRRCGSASDIAAKIMDALDLDPRVTVLGHIQRGGAPYTLQTVDLMRVFYIKRSIVPCMDR